jgi:acetylornithine aminotransferase
MRLQDNGLALVKGTGATVTDDAGREYLDLGGGVVANILGHAHPAVMAAVAAQTAPFGRVTGRHMAEPAGLLGDLLLALTGARRVLFTDSGAGANTAALELARLTGRSRVVVTGALGGRPRREVTHVPYGDAEALRAAVDGGTAMVVLQPIHDHNGVVVPPPGYLTAARNICTAAGALLVFDEARTGLGRTGHWFHHQSEGVAPDLITLAGELGGGLRLGACLAFGAAADLLSLVAHGTSFVADPVSCAAGLAVIRTIAGKGLLDHVKRVGGRLRDGIEALAHPLVAEVRGAGLLLGIVLAEPVAGPVTERLHAAGFLAAAVQPAVVRLAPPLILTAAQADAFVAVLPQALAGVSGAHRKLQNAA